MKLMIRAHDLGVKGEENIIARLRELDLDGAQDGELAEEFRRYRKETWV